MDFVRLDWDGGIATITLDRPKALNALNGQTLKELESAIAAVAANTAARALIVTGAGEKAFVAGADIAEMSSYSATQARAFAELGHRTFAALESLAVPTLAAVNGFALGGGLELAVSCDLIYASNTAKLGVPEVTLAVIPGFGGTQRLPRLLGPMRARELVFSGEMVDAEKARSMGLVLEVLEPAALVPHVKKVAETIAKRGPIAVAQAKRVMRAGAGMSLADACELERQGFAALFGSADQIEGMKAFVEKRPAQFVGQ